MYLHLGQDIMVPHRDVLGIFDLDTTTTTQITRDFLARCEKQGEVVNISENLPKSFVLCSHRGQIRLYISPLSASTLLRRAKQTLSDEIRASDNDE